MRLATESELSNAVLDMPSGVGAVPEEDRLAGAIAGRRQCVAVEIGCGIASNATRCSLLKWRC